MVKKITALLLLLTVAFTVSGCGGKRVKKSDVAGADAQEQFWETDLDKSAKYLAGFRAQTPEEVTSIWRQAVMQGNGALLYALYSPDLKEVLLDEMKATTGSWNMYYLDESKMPADVICSDPEEVEGEDIFISDVTTIKTDGTLSYSQLVIELVDGGYFVTSKVAEYEVRPEEYGENFLRDYGGEAFTE